MVALLLAGSVAAVAAFQPLAADLATRDRPQTDSEPGTLGSTD